MPRKLTPWLPKPTCNSNLLQSKSFSIVLTLWLDCAKQPWRRGSVCFDLRSGPFDQKVKDRILIEEPRLSLYPPNRRVLQNQQLNA